MPDHQQVIQEQTVNPQLQIKYTALLDQFASYDRMAVAFSGGVDSALLLFAAHEALGDGAVAITADCPLFPKRELDEAIGFCERYGIEQAVVETHQLDDDEFTRNSPERCYVCKKLIMSALEAKASELDIEVLAEGSNLDDVSDYRPGFKAVEEAGIMSPLKAAGLTKQDIRDISKALGLPTWNKQSFACLATRIPTGTTITEARLDRIDAAEQALIDLGFRQVRVRDHGVVARIEVAPEEIGRLLDRELRTQADAAVKATGFKHVTVDLAGYRTGSMNPVCE